MRYCKTCKKEIDRGYHGHILKTYCSQKCRIIGRKTGPSSKRVCEKCGKEFLVPPSYKGRFCSDKCVSEFQRGENSPCWKGGKPKCKVCGKVLSVRGLTYCLKHAVEKAKYKISGANHYNWKGGTGSKRHQEMGRIEYKLWRTAVFTRDNFTCIWCGQCGGRLEADHIKPWILYPELRYAIDNGRTLCKECHSKTDTWGSRVRNVERT